MVGLIPLPLTGGVLFCILMHETDDLRHEKTKDNKNIKCKKNVPQIGTKKETP